MIKLGLRLWAYIQAERSQGRTAPIDPFSRQIRPSACHGVPLGGMGSGSIGRGFRGEFRRWQLIPGVCEEAPVLANQFSVFVSRDGGKKYSSVLYPGRPSELGVAVNAVDNAGISSWDWNMSGQHSTYHAVFPRAWTIYEGEPDPELKISCRQVSPFIPNNYRESCLPSTVFSYTVINTGKSNATVSLLFSWANSVGGSSHLSGGHFNESFKEEDGVSGILLHHKTAKGHPPITFAIAAQDTNEVNVSVCPCFSLLGKDGEFSAKDMWTEMKEHGTFSESHWDSLPIAVSPPGGSIAGAVAATVVLQPHEKKTVTFTLVWDSPKVKFLKGRSYYRRYTKFYGFSGKAATRLAHDAILDFPKWEDAIIKWQEPILTNESLPEWYRFTLFNELYFLVAGGTIWTESETGTEKGESLATDRATKLVVSNHTTTDVQAETCPDVQTGELKNVEREDNANSMEENSPKISTGSSENGEQSVLSNDTTTEIQAEICRDAHTGESKIVDQEDTANSRERNSLNHSKVSSSVEAIISKPHLSYLCDAPHPFEFIDAGGREDEQSDEQNDEHDVACQRNSPTHSRVCEEMQDKAEASSAVFSMQALEHGDAHVIEDHRNDNNVGRFLYLEGLEYVMWCTYDVHFYASFALLELFPKLELCIQQEFADATLKQNLEKTKFLTDADRGVRKVLGAVPHDLGMHDPWIEVNAYNIHDTSKWKDLNCKFVLQVYRDFVVTQDIDFANKAWPSVFTAMAYMDKFDKDRDGLIENDGFPDQTYDTWTVHGVSAYCGGLWLAALQASASMAEKLNHSDNAKSFIAKFNQAKDAYEKKLWNGAYFNYDSGTSSNSNSIQADQLAGQMYMYASGLAPLFEEEKIKSTLGKIFEYNVMKVKGGKFGAVNGMHPDGKVDETCMQSREIWTGVTYLLAATMIHAGMVDEAFRTAEGIFHAGWSEEGFGYWFQTPESWTVNGHYRSLAYMRPLSIWAMQCAFNSKQCTVDATKDTEKGRSFSSHMGFSAITEVFGKVQKPQMENIRTCLRCLHDCMCKKC